jgi:hypothetical protein
MVGTTLVEKWVEAGRRLTEALDNSGLEVVASFWFLDSETDEWRLMIAMPLVDREGPLEAYRAIQKALDSMRQVELSLSDISVVSPNHSLVKLLRRAVTTDRTISGVRFARSRAGDQFIEDSYIYRLL